MILMTTQFITTFLYLCIEVCINGTTEKIKYSKLNDKQGKLTFIITELKDNNKDIEYSNPKYYQLVKNVKFRHVALDYTSKKGQFYIHSNPNWDKILTPNSNKDKRININSDIRKINFNGYALIYFVEGDTNPFYDGFPDTPGSSISLSE